VFAFDFDAYYDQIRFNGALGNRRGPQLTPDVEGAQ
jgi:hypothetical protein